MDSYLSVWLADPSVRSGPVGAKMEYGTLNHPGGRGREPCRDPPSLPCICALPLQLAQVPLSMTFPISCHVQVSAKQLHTRVHRPANAVVLDAPSEYLPIHEQVKGLEFSKTAPFQDGKLQEVLTFVRSGRIRITRDTIYQLLQCCVQTKDLLASRQAQHFMFLLGLESVSSLADHLIRLFASCGCLLEADRTFSMISRPTVYSWSAIISAYTDLGRDYKALYLYVDMQQAGIEPDKVVFLCVLRVCSLTGSLHDGRLIFHQVLTSGIGCDMAISSVLIAMFANCQCLEDARRVFDMAPSIDDVMWGAMLTGYTVNNEVSAAFSLYERMMHEGVNLNEVLYGCMLKACSCEGRIEPGMVIHHQMMENSVEPNIIIGSSLIDMYAKAGSLIEAQNVFDWLPTRNLVSWGTMIGGYVQYGYGFLALALFEKMQYSGIKADKVILLHVLKACDTGSFLIHCRFLHDLIIRIRMDSNIIIGNALIEVYGNQGSLKDCHNVFDQLTMKDTNSWNALIGAHAGNGNSFLACELFEQMEKEGALANNVTYLHLIKACSSTVMIVQGRTIHDQITSIGLESDCVIGSSLIDMYAKYGVFEELRKVFEHLTEKDIVSWGALLSAYSEHGHYSFVCELYDEMQCKGVKPDKAIFLCVLKACGITGSLKQGHCVHYEVVRSNIEFDQSIGNTIIDMYAKCGSQDEANKIFYNLPHRDDVSWAALIGGYVKCSDCNQVGDFIGAMKEHGLRPGGSIFTNILAACSHAGESEDGLLYFSAMKDMGIEPDMEQYSCIIDLFSRKGCFNEAKDVLQSMPSLPDLVVWMSMLTSCKTYGEVKCGSCCFGYISQTESNDASGYVLTWNKNADAEMWGNTMKTLHIKG